jgi:hypothetical protein
MSDLLNKYKWRPVWYTPSFCCGLSAFVLTEGKLIHKLFGCKIIYLEHDGKWRTTKVGNGEIDIDRSSDERMSAEEICEEYLICKLAGIESNIRCRL